MVFSSLTFLFGFLPATLLLYYIVRGTKARNCVLCVASLVFYAWGEPRYIILMIGSILLNYLLGILMSRTEAQTHRRIVLITALTVNLGMLGLFKYSHFIFGNINTLCGMDLPLLALSLPLGISFYTFQVLSYIIDVYRKKTPAQTNILNLATYIALFPQLVAGPIVRYDQIQNELNHRNITITDAAEGIMRFAVGLGKKVILANAMASIADPIFNETILPSGTAWLAAVAYTFQIYFDFSGYSDMAIGLGRLFGFHFSENFRYPYMAVSITDFWRRWHISLSNWFRDYVYIPLGGSHKSKFRNIMNLLIVWTLTGFWHGAGWNFILWGLYYGLLLILEKYVLKDLLAKLPVIIRRILTLLLVMLGWIVFRVESLNAIAECIRSLFICPINGLGAYLTQHPNVLENTFWLLPAFLACFPWSSYIPNRLKSKSWFPWIRGAWSLAVYAVSVILLLGSTYNPFIYFRF